MNAPALALPIVADVIEDIVIDEDKIDDEATREADDEITAEAVCTATRLLQESKSIPEITAALGKSYEDLDIDHTIQRAQARIKRWKKEIDAELAAKVAADALIDPRDEVIRKLKKEVEMLLDGLHDFDLEFPELDELDEDLEGLEPDEVIRILREHTAMLYAAMRSVRSAPDIGYNPKFGKWNGVVLGFNTGDKKVWLDVDGVNVEDNTRVKLEPWMKERFAAQWLEDEQIEKESNKTYRGDSEYPVRILPPQPGPVWRDKVLYGISGEIIEKISANCEAHPAGLLTDFLVSFGNMIGRGPYFSVNETKHYTNEFMVRVGDSSKSRKGTGRDVIDRVLEQVDKTWFTDRVTSGFGSAEAIISQIKDSSMETRQVTVRGVKGTEQYLNRGVDDKRLYVRDGEIASVFVLADKKESFASVVLRQAWDGKALRNIVKGKTVEGLSNSAKCEEPHISISGDTTIHELRVKMPKGADENGFGNRFLYVYVYRVKECPNGGPPLDWSKEVVQLCETLQWARKVKHVSMTPAARQWWFDHYHALEHEGAEGEAGKMTARGPAHVRRIAMIYALLDRSDQVDTKHFQAALRLWNYCSESAVFIFGGATSEQLRIQSWIGQRQSATYQQVRNDLYQRNKLAKDIKADLTEMVSKGMLKLVGDNYTKANV